MIPVFTLNRQHQQLANEFHDIFSTVITRDRYILGQEVEAFEREFAGYIGTQYAIGVGNGTDAITLTLLAMGLQPGDEVILPANSYPSVFALPAAGIIPKLVDIDPYTYVLDPKKIELAISKKTKAIMPVHLYGQAADMESILKVANAYGLPVIEDCAQAAGAEYGVQKSEFRKVGSIGIAGCYSFYPTKNIGALGDGGMVVTNDEEIYEKIKLLRMYGEKDRYQSVMLGRNSRLDELQAAFLRIKLRHLDEWVTRRRDIAEMYRMNNLPAQAGEPMNHVTMPFEAEYVKHAYHLFVVRSEKRDELKVYLENEGVGTGIHYPVPIHLVESFRYLGYRAGDFPESERACREVLSLPMWPELTNKEVERIVGHLRHLGTLSNI